MIKSKLRKIAFVFSSLAVRARAPAGSETARRDRDRNSTQRPCCAPGPRKVRTLPI